MATHLVISTKSGISCTKKTPKENPMTAMATHINQTFLKVKIKVEEYHKILAVSPELVLDLITQLRKGFS